MPKNLVSKCYFYTDDVIPYGLCNDLLQHFPQYWWNE